MTDPISSETLLACLRTIVSEAGSQQKAAQKLGVSAVYLGDVLRGNRAPAKKLLDALGYRRVVVYWPVNRKR